MYRRADIVADRAPAPVQGIALQNRAAPAAVGVVVNLILAVCGIVANLVGVNFDEPFFLRAAKDARLHHRFHGLGEQRQNVKAHRSASPQ